ncbi:biliverdin-producing heme oxygenase [Pseudonocardia sp. RS11V-5]|uniref:biliverdin-producing heme oxygenase n=1 Tax=Pseudonocardia terrae TaxID=2905831 RepID=UPI001E4411C6|nr:biliverdin-producing heme oxygenase [Pseudonocardia terrae]MCE3553631.1 biliverdin-producing heme oxygenase [Pseudonocardia terrae]
MGELSTGLRRATAEIHERAHRSTYMAALLDGRLPLSAYTLLAQQYLAIYGALEATGDALAADPAAGPFVIDELRRLPALRRDVTALGGSVDSPRVLPATGAYVARLREAATDAPVFVAHHYTRYLGDLAGGQVVRRMLERTYGVTGPGALFYDFSALGSPSVFRKRYRTLLDGAPFDEIEQRRAADEAVRAFELNIAVFDELAEATGLPAAA